MNDGPCRRSCCWTPYGHSTVRDAETGDLRCRCHDSSIKAPPPRARVEKLSIHDLEWQAMNEHLQRLFREKRAS